MWPSTRKPMDSNEVLVERSAVVELNTRHAGNEFVR